MTRIDELDFDRPMVLWGADDVALDVRVARVERGPGLMPRWYARLDEPVGSAPAGILLLRRTAPGVTLVERILAADTPADAPVIRWSALGGLGLRDGLWYLADSREHHAEDRSAYLGAIDELREEGIDPRSTLALEHPVLRRLTGIPEPQPRISELDYVIPSLLWDRADDVWQLPTAYVSDERGLVTWAHAAEHVGPFAPGYYRFVIGKMEYAVAYRAHDDDRADQPVRPGDRIASYNWAEDPRSAPPFER